MKKRQRRPSRPAASTASATPAVAPWPNVPPGNPRYLAALILKQLLKERCDAKLLIERTLEDIRLDPRDRGLLMELIYGVLRRRENLVRLIELLSSTPFKKLDPFLAAVLQVGFYQLFFLDRIPESAAVNEAVNSCRQADLPKFLQGFTNGVLRQATRKKDELAEALHTGKNGNRLSNHPQWLVQRWQKQFGSAETERICASNNKEPMLILRCSDTSAQQELLTLFEQHGIDCHTGRFCPEAICLPQFHGSISSLPGYDRGLFQVQDQAAQLAIYLLGPFREGGCYLDGCAGLGGKTTHLLQLALRHNFSVHATEPEPARLEKLKANVERLFPPSLQEQTPSAKELPLILHESTIQAMIAPEGPGKPSGTQKYDGILIDAPCSGTGVIGRQPEIRWNRRPADLGRYQEIQQELLNSAASLLAEDGVLVYSTCSLEPEENSGVIEQFLAANPHFQLSDCSELLPEPARRFIRNGCFQPLPEEEIDGFFAARLVRR